ncbi:MAG: DUF418 domain-containing protein [Pyrinomonadaceae bacterium]
MSLTNNSEIGPIASTERIAVLDVLRGLAVGGILIGNLQWFSGYGWMPPSLATLNPATDQLIRFLVHAFVEGKFYSIFSFLFGFGFALQIARAEERGDTNARLFKRRLMWLFVIGATHAVFIWAGDILTVYALMGFVLLLFRRKSNESLLKWAAILLAVPVAFYILSFVLFVTFAPPDVMTQISAMQFEMWSNGLRTVSNGNYTQIFSDYNLNMLFGRWMGLIMQMRLPKILAMFLLGVYAYRIGVFQNPAQHRVLIRRVMIYGLGFGLILNGIFATFAKSEADFPPTLPGVIGVAAYAYGVPALALGIAALIVRLWETGILKRALATLAPVGRMALTNYLLHSVICVSLFYGYGFGLFGRFGAAGSTLIGIAIFGAQIAASGVWLRLFRYGPMEWIWRQLTYGKRLSLLPERP